MITICMHCKRILIFGRGYISHGICKKCLFKSLWIEGLEVKEIESTVNQLKGG